MSSVDQYRWKCIRKKGQCAFCEIYAFHTSQVRKLYFTELEIFNSATDNSKTEKQ